jgi:hypothetical protein
MLQAAAGKNSRHNELVVYIHSASYFSFSRHCILAVVIWADENILIGELPFAFSDPFRCSRSLATLHDGI